MPALLSPLSVPWYWEPYVLALGIKDWWGEVSAVTHEQMLRTSVVVLSRDRHRLFRRASCGVLLFVLYLFLAKRVIAPAFDSGLFHPSRTVLLSTVGTLATLSVLFLLLRALRHVLRGLRSLHARGMRVLVERAKS